VIAHYTRRMIQELLDHGYTECVVNPADRYGEPEPFSRSKNRARSRVHNAARRAGVDIETGIRLVPGLRSIPPHYVITGRVKP
jgi:hypothetical protein